MSGSASIGAGFAEVGESDDLLVDCFLRGERAAFAAIVDRHQARLLRLAFRLLGWSDEAREVVQEVFLAALQSLGRFDRRAGLATWLTVITVNKCRTHRRKRWLRLRTWKAVQRGQPKRVGRVSPAEVRSAGETRSTGGDPEESARVRDAVASLPSGCREVIVLRYLEELPIERVADVLGLSVSAVNTRLHRARRRLEALLKDAPQDRGDE